MEDVAANREQQHDKRKEREDGVGGNAEGVGVDLGPRHVPCEGDDLGPKTVLPGRRAGRPPSAAAAALACSTQTIRFDRER